MSNQTITGIARSAETIRDRREMALHMLRLLRERYEAETKPYIDMLVQIEQMRTPTISIPIEKYQEFMSASANDHSNK
jgi:plasmid replication initiation protein